MRFLDLYEGKNDKEKENNINVDYTYKDALKDIDSDNLYNLVCNIHRTKHNSGVSTKGFYIGGDFIEYKDSKFQELANKLRKKYDTKLEAKLKELAKKRYTEQVPDKKTAEADKMLIDTSLAKFLQNPKLATTNGNSKNPHGIASPDLYEKIGQSLVYRTSEFVSKLADTTTKIDEGKFKQLMIDAFNKNEEENFLYGLMDIEGKMRIDAAKQTVQQTAGNNDANNKFGKEEKPEGKKDNNDNEADSDDESQLGDSYYANLSAQLKTANLLLEDVDVPRRVEQFSNRASVALKQADAVEATWPRQFKSWYDQYKAAFDKGVKEAQDKVRKGGAGDEKYVPDPLTHEKINIRKGWGTGGPQAFLDDLYAKYPSAKKAADAINSGNLTIFNMGPRLILGLCKGLSEGGKLLQTMKDDFGEAFKEIKAAFKSGGSTKDYEAQVEESMENGNYGEALATQSAVIAVDCSQLLTLMENGPIGTVDFDNNTFSTANSNDQSSLEVAVQNLIGQLNTYSDVYQKYEQNKDVKINDTAQDVEINSKDEDKKKEKEAEDEDTEEGSESVTDNTKPVYRPFTQFLTEDDESKSDDNESKSDDESKSDGDSDDESNTQEGQLNATLEQMAIVKSTFDDFLDIPRLKEIHKVLKSFTEGDELENVDGGLDSLKTIITLYDIMIKEDLKFDLTSDSIKNFVDGLKAINEVKEIPKIENQPINISPDIKTFPAMEHTGTPKKKVSSEENAGKLADAIKASFTDELIKEVQDLNKFARSCENDSWFNNYKAKIEKLNELRDKLTTELEKVYGAGKVDKWYYEAIEELDNLNYLPKLYKLMAIGACIASQLEDQSGKDMEESVEVTPIKIVKKTGTVYRSLYENDDNSGNDQDGNDDQGNDNQGNDEQGEQENKGKNQGKDNKDPFEIVKHNIPTLEERLNSVDFTHILPPDKNHKVYQIDGVEQFNQYMRSFANNAEKGLAIVKGTNGNGIVPIARNIVSQDNDAGKKMRDYLNAKNCKQICTMFNEGTDKNREYSDLYAYYSTSWAILKRSKEVFTKTEGEEDTKAREGINRESNDIQKDSYQFPGVSPDSLINEIYKYIRGSK